MVCGICGIDKPDCDYYFKPKPTVDHVTTMYSDGQ